MYVDLIKIFAPLAVFMLLPIWIPIIAVVIGRLTDSFRGGGTDPVAARLDELKRRSLAARPAREAA